MRGEIAVESEPGRGSVFTVRIPQKQIGNSVCGADLTAKLQGSGFHDLPVSKKTQFLREYMPYGSVLVVDDVESNLYVATGLLQPYGLNIETAANGYQAIERIKDGNIYDIIFMDHMMPDIDGMEVTKILRKSGYRGTIIALTANAIAGRAEMFLQSGFDGFISKPVDSRELNYALNEFIRNKKPPEVVEAARKVRESKRVAYEPGKIEQPGNYLVKAAIIDFENALATLDMLFSASDDSRRLDLNLYTITVHGIKNVLTNIGQPELSATAYQLEQAGSNEEMDVILDKTPAFIQALKDVLEGLRS